MSDIENLRDELCRAVDRASDQGGSSERELGKFSRRLLALSGVFCEDMASALRRHDYGRVMQLIADIIEHNKHARVAA